MVDLKASNFMGAVHLVLMVAASMMFVTNVSCFRPK